MGLLHILTESGTSKPQQSLAQTKARLESAAADYAKQVATYTKWLDYVMSLMPKMEAAAALVKSEPFVHNKGVSFNVGVSSSEVNWKQLEEACAPLTIRIDAAKPGWVQACFMIERPPAFPKAVLAGL